MEPLYGEFQRGTVDPNDLLLDPNNPRYQGDFSDFVFVPYDQIGEDSHQKRALSRIETERFGVRQLAEAIAQVGYLPIDNLVVVRYDEKRYLVLEGNRRAAALKMILDGRVQYKLDNVETLREIPVLVLQEPYEKASVDQWLIQGTRHVGGVKPWGPYQKARALQILQREQGMRMDEAATALGLSATEANKSIRALRAFEAVQEDPVFGRRVRTEHFSFFDEMIRKPALRNYFGWNNYAMKFEDPQKRELFFALFLGEPRNEKPPKIRAALQLREIPKILESSEARASLEDLDQPFERAVHFAALGERRAIVSDMISRLEYIAQDIARLSRRKLDDAQQKTLQQVRAILQEILERQG